MLIAIVDVCTEADDRPTALAHLAAELPTVRAMPGCLGMRVLTPADDDRRLTVLHEWQDDASFAAYTASDAFARAGARVRPLAVEPPVSRRFHAQPAG